MFLFVIYALGVWYLAFLWRRSMAGYGAVIGGILVLVGVAWMHIVLVRRWPMWFNLPVLQIMLYPYTILVGVMGFFIASLPPSGRRACGYDLSGHEGEEIGRCPECGTTTNEMRTRRGRRRARRRIRLEAKKKRAPNVWSPAPGEADTGTGEQDQRGHTKRHSPSERRERARVDRPDP